MKNEVNNPNTYSAPKYPTLAQVGAFAKGKSITKAAAVAALVAAVSMGTACGEDTAKYTGDGVGEKIQSISESIDDVYQVEGVIQIDGEVQSGGETEYIELEGDTQTDTEWEIAGDMTAPAETEPEET